MLKNTLLLLTLLLMTGCVERGYKVTINSTTHTVTAENSVDITNVKIKTDTELQKMQKAVQKANRITPIKRKVSQKEIKRQQLKNKVALALAKKKSKEARLRRLLEEKKLKLEQAEKRKKVLLLKKKNKNKEAKHLKKTMKEALEAFEEKKATELKKEKKERIALKQKVTHPVVVPKKGKHQKVLATTQPLRFNLIKKTYHKFGTSEIHGRVIYLDKSKQKIRLRKSKIYILPVTATIDNWFNRYYLKNKNTASDRAITVKYINSTYLNLEKNFEFYGVPEGTYYIIIESNYPSYMAKNKKVYIAKKIEVGKHKKVMAVFSKQL